MSRMTSLVYHSQYWLYHTRLKHTAILIDQGIEDRTASYVVANLRRGIFKLDGL